MIKLAKSFFQAVLGQSHKQNKFSLSASLIIQFLSNLQLTYLILQPALNPKNNIYLKVLKAILTLSSLTVGWNAFDPISSNTVIFTVSWIVLIYIFLLGVLTIAILLKSLQITQDSPRTIRFIRVLYLIHSKLLFCPIHYFLMWMVSLNNQCTRLGYRNSTQCFVQVTTIGILFGVLNFMVAFLSEFLLYRTKKSKDALSQKNNHYFQALLIHKMTVVILMLLAMDIKYIAPIFNFTFSIIHCFNVLIPLPFYNFHMLRVSLFYIASHLTLSLMLLVSISGSGRKYLESFSVILVVFLLKVFILYTNYCLKRILRLEFRTPSDAAHVLVLLSRYTARYSNIPKLDYNYREGSFYLYGILRRYNIDTANLQDFSTLSEYNKQLYSIVLARLNSLLRKYPKSEAIILTMSQIYIQKAENPAKALVLLNKLETLRPSVQVQAVIEDMYSKLEKIYNKAYTEDDLDILKYFKHRDHANLLKSSIQSEMSLHIKLWQELAVEKVNVRSIGDLSEKIDKLCSQIKKTWSESIRKYEQAFTAPYLVYGVYLEAIRKDAYGSLQIIQKYTDLRKNRQSVSKSKSVFSDNVAIILASIEADKAGRVLDASSSVQSVFHVSKDRLIGQNVNIILPRIIAIRHDDFIINYYNNTKQELNRCFESYGKTRDGDLIPLEVKLKIYPYIDKGLNLLAHVRKLRNTELLLILDKDGNIADCSEGLFDLFNLTKRDLDSTKGFELCSELKEVEQAFQLVYAKVKNETSFQFKTPSIDEFVDRTGFKSDPFRKRDSASGPLNRSFGRAEEDTISINSHVYPLMSPTEMKNTLLFSPTSVLKPNHRPSNFLKNGPEHRLSIVASLTAMKKVAEETCHKFENGGKLSFYPKNPTNRSINNGDRMDFMVVIKPYTLAGELFKIIKFKEIYSKEKIMLKDGTPGSFEEVQSSKETSPTVKSNTLGEFAGQFPADDERTPRSVINKFSLKEIIVSADQEKPQTKLDAFKALLAKHTKNNSLDKMLSRGDQVENLLYKSRVTNDSSSVRNKGASVSKAFNNLFQKETMRPMTKIAVLVVYLMIILVILFVTLVYFFSNKSFQQTRDGAMIVDAASHRILYSMTAWQYYMLIYSRAVKLRPSIAAVITSFQQTILTNTLFMLNENDKLQELLQSSMNQDLIEIFYQKDIALWQPYTNTTFDGGYVNGFTATNVIAQKAIKVAGYTDSIYNLNGNTGFLFAMNNSCNSYLVSSQRHIQETESLIQKIIANNQSLVKALIVLEVVALFFVLLSVILVVVVIVNSYNKLFRVLTRLHPEEQSQRLSELVIARDCLSKDIETKEFVNKVELQFDSVNKLTKKGAKKKLIVRYQGDRIVMKYLVLEALQPLLRTFVFIVGVVIIFFIFYFSSISTLSSLQQVNKQLSIAHQLAYYSSMTTGMFYFNVIFQNDTSFLIHYLPPKIEIQRTLNTFSKANENLLSVFQEKNKGITDPFVETFFRTDVCSYMNASLLTTCRNVTLGGAIGLLGLNFQFNQYSSSFINQYDENPTFDVGAQVFVLYSNTLGNYYSVFPAAYSILQTYLLNDLEKRTNSQKKENLMFFTLILASMSVFSVLVRVLIIQKLKNIDVRIRKILKVIPLGVIKGNRLFEFYLKSEFKEELEDIKQLI